MRVTLKHLFLLLFFLAFFINLILSGLLTYGYNLRKLRTYKTLAGCFFFFGLFTFFWYLSSYLVLNIYHRQSLFYTTIEALAIICVGVAVYYWLNWLIMITFRTERPGYLHLVWVPTAILVFIKYSYDIFGKNLAVLYWIKLSAWACLFGGVVVLSLISFIRRAEIHDAVSKQFHQLITLGGVLLPVAGLVDYFFIHAKFYEGRVRLSMNFPVFILCYLAFGIILIITLIRNLGKMEPSRQQMDALAELYQITLRELEVVDLVLKGKSNQEIAQILVIAPATVKNHLHHIFEKTRCTNRYEQISLVLSIK